MQIRFVVGKGTMQNQPREKEHGHSLGEASLNLHMRLLLAKHRSTLASSSSRLSARMLVRG